MSRKSINSLMYQGTTKKFNLPIEHLDYSYIEQCTNVKYLEKILIVLRSGEEGAYPDLTAFCEKKVQELDPRSRALRKNNLLATAADFTKEEWKEITSDFKNGFGEKKPTKKRPTPRDYEEWDKFDVEKECAKIDEGKQELVSKTIFNDSVSGIEKEIDTTGMTDQEKVLLADREKDKGNEAFRAGDHKEALLYYTRSISVMPNVSAFNNRAQTEIKLQEWQKALKDVEKVLELDPGNLKAYLRRATVYKHLGNHQAASDDLKKVLQAEPDNSLAKNLLQELEQKLKNLQPCVKTEKKGKKMVIKEVEDSDDEGERKYVDRNKDPSTLLVTETSKTNAVMGNAQTKHLPDGKSQIKEKKRGKTAEQENTKKGSGGNLAALKKTLQSKYGQEIKSENVKNVTVSVTGGQETARMDSSQIHPPGSSSETEKVGNSPLPLAPPVSKLKSDGNELFKNGQFGDAVLKYTEAIRELSESGVDCPKELSILHSNRAACYLKDGNCNECIKDCTRALELQPFSIKPLLRRALAYESLERYRQAYVDYKIVLQVDNRIQLANDSVNRITKALIEEDGSKWREKLSPIPVVPVSAQVHRGEDDSITAGIGNKSQITNENQNKLPNYSNCTTHQDLGKNIEERFISLKQEGNSFVKRTQYKEAIAKYNECLKLKSNECAIYTNRALCHLKLYQYKEAKDDCNTALRVEPMNIKALYRRALAYRGLKNYAASRDDLSKLVELDSSVTEAQKELLEVSEILRKVDSGGSLSKTNDQEKQRKNIHIQEVADSDEEENEIQTTREHKSIPNLNAGQVESNRHSALGNSHPPSDIKVNLKPTNAYEFGQALQVLQAKNDLARCGKLLRNVKPEDLPVMMGNKLEADVYIMIIQALKGHLLEKYPNLVYWHLVHLCKAERFKIASVIVGKERDQVQLLFSSLLQIMSNEFTSEDVQNLAKSYDL
ncbi:sperm-associated antigen 1-like isoform X2 [Narcine bancroftii]|uniref:sperm-associated antigen 1-like isoform X2 n=1 Tax=Narcine bancroftii TaxID=1343680 RepID=UPI0038316B31